MDKEMKAVEFDAYAQRRDEVKDLKKENDELRRMNAELNQKVNDIYGAYQTLEYTCGGRIRIYSTEIQQLRQEIDALKKKLRLQGREDE